ncbi:MAG: hypothetical protein HC923_02295 [Myxococcales bacterium]|nr:hypothetical protein [Myxococcales bacterium]
MQKNPLEVMTVTRRRALQVLGATVVVPAGVLAACQEQGGGAKTNTTEKKAMEPAKQPEAAKPSSAPAQADRQPSEAGSQPTAAADANLNCAEQGTIDDKSQNMRKTLQYVEISPHADKVCNNCMQWVVPQGDAKCGGCTLFTGPVNPKGYCTAYVKKAG